MVSVFNIQQRGMVVYNAQHDVAGIHSDRNSWNHINSGSKYEMLWGFPDKESDRRINYGEITFSLVGDNPTNQQPHVRSNIGGVLFNLIPTAGKTQEQLMNERRLAWWNSVRLQGVCVKECKYDKNGMAVEDPVLAIGGGYSFKNNSGTTIPRGAICMASLPDMRTVRTYERQTLVYTPLNAKNIAEHVSSREEMLLLFENVHFKEMLNMFMYFCSAEFQTAPQEDLDSLTKVTMDERTASLEFQPPGRAREIRNLDMAGQSVIRDRIIHVLSTNDALRYLFVQKFGANAANFMTEVASKTVCVSYRTAADKDTCDGVRTPQIGSLLTKF